MARTLDDVAARTGVSRATVSRVINGGSVAPATRARVLEALASTGYRPNVAARTLASGRSGVVGVVIHVPPDVLFQDVFFSRLFHGISGALAERGAGMMLWLADLTKEQTLERILAMRLFDGIIVTADMLDDPLVDGLITSTLPTVLVGHRHKDRAASYVDIDNVAAAELVTAHLVSLGRRRIGHITGRRGSVSGEERLAGYRRAMLRAGLPTDDLVVEGDYLTPSGAAGAAQLAERGADAIFCASDAMARGALDELKARGARAPDDIAVAGFDDLDFAATLEPPLTTIRQDVDQLGVEAAHALFRLLGSDGSTPQRVVLPTELVIRQSTVGPVRGRSGPTTRSGTDR